MTNYRNYAEEMIGKTLNDGEIMTYDQLVKAMVCKSKLSSMLKAYQKKVNNLESKSCGILKRFSRSFDIKAYKKKIEEIKSIIDDIKEEFNDYVESHCDDRDLILDMYHLCR